MNTTMNENEDALVELAKKQFGTLTAAEEKLFRKTAAGEAADYSSPIEDDNDPANAESWGDNRVLKADRIEWLCADKKAKEYITHKGLEIQGARIEGVLDLEGVRFPYTCILYRCAIDKELILQDSRFLNLALSGSSTGAISADRMKL
jgi:hypothetical protein